MISIDIPGRGVFKLRNLVLDMNGTIAVDGIIPEEVLDKIRILSEKLDIHLITADTHGKLDAVRDKIAARVVRVYPPGEIFQKAELIEGLGPSNCAAIGNGSNDVEMLKKAIIAIAVIGGEGCAAEALLAADVVVHNSLDALELFINPKRLIATLRK